jgi:hypothetical protein
MPHMLPSYEQRNTTVKLERTMLEGAGMSMLREEAQELRFALSKLLGSRSEAYARRVNDR